jgi:beta-xylosidase
MHENMAEQPDLDALIKSGLGQLTRPFGSAPVDPALGALSLARTQTAVAAASRFGIPALAHEECLAGFAAWGATIYPVPPAWGASFDPELVGEMAGRIGRDLRSVGVHQGLAPVLDVVRDLRWGRVEETIGEDPCLVGEIGAAYVRGLQSAGVVATLKHFAAYAASALGRNHAPVHIGPRELADVILPPFEHAVLAGGVRSVMNSYTELDGVPAASDASMLTGLLRDTWGFTGTVVSDYFAIGFLETAHGVAADEADAARLALTAGVDVELPTVHAYGQRLIDAVERGEIGEEYVDRALTRVLTQKCELGLLDPDWDPVPPILRVDRSEGLPDPAPGSISLDSPDNRAVARRLAEESVILLDNRSGVLPLAAGTREIALVGPLADDASAMLGCYSFPAHVGPQHPDVPLGLSIPTVLEALREELADAKVTSALGCGVMDAALNQTRLARAVEVARQAEVCIAVLGDKAGLMGRGTSGEGCDAPDLALPGPQGEFLEALLATGTPVVLVLMAGRPYALGPYADRLAAAVQAFFPGEEGAAAVAGVLSGRVNPGGRLPLSMPRTPSGQPWTYLQPQLGRVNPNSSVDPTPLYPFGHGLSYTSFAWEDFAVDTDEVSVEDGEFEVEVTVRNVGDRAGSEVVQLYLHDPVAQVTRPWARLIGFAKVRLDPGEAKRIRLIGHADLTAFTGRSGKRVVEPGDIELRLASSSADEAVRHRATLRLVGQLRELPPPRERSVPSRLVCRVEIVG